MKDWLYAKSEWTDLADSMVFGIQKFFIPTLVTYESWGIMRSYSIFRKIWVMAKGMFTVWRALASLSISEVPCGQTKGATLAKAQRVVEWCVVTSWWVTERMSWTSSRNHCHAVIISNDLIRKISFHRKCITNYYGCKYTINFNHLACLLYVQAWKLAICWYFVLVPYILRNVLLHQSFVDVTWT